MFWTLRGNEYSPVILLASPNTTKPSSTETKLVQNSSFFCERNNVVPGFPGRAPFSQRSQSSFGCLTNVFFRERFKSAHYHQFTLQPRVLLKLVSHLKEPFDRLGD